MMVFTFIDSFSPCNSKTVAIKTMIKAIKSKRPPVFPAVPGADCKALGRLMPNPAKRFLKYADQLTAVEEAANKYSEINDQPTIQATISP